MELETIYQNTNGSKAKASLAQVIRNYIIVLAVNPNSGANEDDKRATVKFVNEDLYGWKGIYASDFQDAETKLKTEIGKNGKADVVILHTHGGIIRATNEVGLYPNNFSTQSLNESHLRAFLGYNEVIENEKKAQIEREEKRQEKIDNREKQRQERKKAYDLLKNKEARAEAEEKEREIEAKEKEDDEEWESRKSFQADLIKKKLEGFTLLSEQVRKDIESLKNMVRSAEDDKTFVVSACLSARNNGFLEALLELTEKKVNLIGIVNYSTFPIVDNPKSKEGLFDAKVILDGDGIIKENNSLLYKERDKVTKKRIGVNSAKKFSTNYEIGTSTPIVLNKLNMVKNGIETE